MLSESLRDSRLIEEDHRRVCEASLFFEDSPRKSHCFVTGSEASKQFFQLLPRLRVHAFRIFSYGSGRYPGSGIDV